MAGSLMDFSAYPTLRLASKNGSVSGKIVLESGEAYVRLLRGGHSHANTSWFERTCGTIHISCLRAYLASLPYSRTRPHGWLLDVDDRSRDRRRFFFCRGYLLLRRAR